jgi:hypothetical protein
MRYLVAVTVLAAAAILGAASAASAASAAPPASQAARATSQLSPGWYGYVVTGAKYTSTTADWTMPALHCGTQTTYAAIWTGLDGYSSNTVEQIGAEAFCSGGTAAYFGWYEMYPASQVDFSNPVKPGDRLDATVTYNGSNAFTLTLDDLTQGWMHNVKQTLAGAARSSAETIVEVPGTLSCAPPQALAAFTGDTVDGTALGSLNPVKVTGDDPHIVVSAVSGKTFSVSCN